MGTKPLERKLTAILYADVAGYSRLTGEDEEGTHRALSAYLDAITASIEKHNGTVLHFAGDAVLADFATVSDALICAVAVQQDLKERNKDLSDDRKVQFRIGVNLGEVIVDRNEIYGDGVNVAARLESLAEPGGICISESVHTAVGNKLPLDYEFIGEQAVKNIAKPVRTYSAKLKPDAVLPAPSARRKARRPMHHVMAATAAAVVLVIGAGVIAWWQPWQTREEPASIEHMAFPLPDKPSIAVLPFDNLSGDQEQEYFSDGMTDDLITDLSKISGLFVIARNSTFTYKGKPVKVRQVAEELGVRYVLEGSTRRAGDQVRINAQLIDASTGAHLWAERYDGQLNDILGLQDRITSKIVTALAVNLTTEEAAGRSQLETGDPAAYDAFLQGWAHYRQETPEDYAKAIPFFEEAIEHDPSFSRAYAALALVHWTIADRGWAGQAGLQWQDAINKAKRYLATAKEKPTSLAHIVASEMLLWRSQHEEAITEAERAIRLGPNEAASYLPLASALTFAGRPDEAAEAVKKAMRLNPHYSPGYLSALGRAQFGMEQFAEAAATLERAVKRAPDVEFRYKWLAAAYGQLGRKQEAKAAIEKLNAIYAKRDAPPYTLSRVGTWQTFKKREDEERFREGLRKAGVPPGADPSTGYRELVTKTSNGFEVKGATKIDVATAKALFDRGATFVDVRTPGDWREGIIPGAVLFELHNDLSQERLAKVVRRDDEVVFYCAGRSCYKSADACAKALTWGFRNVYYFARGFPGWGDAGHPVDVPPG
ncbi:MAG: rhodanese-like domain-containing protein [Acidiferrobacterales bacterium]